MTILAVGAHPDDIEFMCAGTLAKYAKRGDEIVMAIATNGEIGSSTLSKEEIAKIRKEEAQAAASVIGAELIWMDFPDEFLFDNKDTRMAFIEMMRKAKPDLVITHPLDDLYHPDHNTTGKIVNDIGLMGTIPNIKTDSPPCLDTPHLCFGDAVAGVNFLPDEYVDISDVFEIKKKMLLMHKSQQSWLNDQYDMTPFEFMQIVAKFRGIQAGCKYAEAFRKISAWPRITAGHLLP